MAIDTITPRSRRAVLLGALGALAASVTTFIRPAATRAGTDGDVALDASNAASGTTTITSSAHAPIVQVVSSGDVGVIGSSGAAAVDIPDPIAASTGVYGL